MLNELSNLLKNLNQKDILYIKFTIFFLIISTFFQFFSIASIVLVISVFFENAIGNNIILINIKNYLNFNSNYNFKLFIIISSLSGLTLSFFFSLVNVYLISSICNRIGLSLEKNFFNHYINCKYISLTKKSLSKILFNLNSCLPKIASYFFPACLVFLTNSIMFIIITTALFITNFYVTLFCFLSLLISYSLFYVFLKKKVIFYGKDSLFISSLKMKFVMNTLGNLKIIKFYNFNKFFENKFNKISYNLSKINNKISITETMPRIFIDYILYAGTIFFLFFLFYFSKNASIDYVEVIFFVICASKLLPTVNQIFASLVSFNANKEAVIQYNRELSIIYTDLSDYELYLNSKNNFFLRHSIELKKIEFSFKQNFRLKFDFLEIKKPNFIGFFGKSGSGKTTCLDIISGILKADKGLLEVDGNVINEKNIYFYRSIISYVPQEIYFGDLKIWEIIAFGQQERDVNMNNVIESAKNAEIHDYILTLPNKYETYFGDDGINLSGGQKQRLAIARGLYKSSQILLLDEVTNELDYKTEELFILTLKRLIKEKSLIVIFVSHRVDSLKLCDQIYIFEKGLITNCGSFLDLRNKSLL
jgi:ABC-type bacteriocin/lantibiotic exporter with double-glycine peptidase domain